MANKEINRTKQKLWLLNYFIVIIIFTLHLNLTIATVTKEETPQNVTLIENNSTAEKPVAEPLIRFRRQPPRTIVKHIIRPKRYKMKHVKRPKIKYNFAEPPPAYYSRKPIVLKKPTFDSSILQEFAHMNVESADFDLPPSSYEAQSMDLDFYNHYEPSLQAASYKEIKKPTFYTYAEPESSYKESLYTEVSKSPTYAYNAPEISFKEDSKPSVAYSFTPSKPRKPHTKYGVPTEVVYSSGYDNPSNGKYTFEAPASKPVYNPHAKNEYSYKKPYKEVPRIPATTYGVPDVHIPATGSNDYNKYSVVEQKPPYSSHASTKTETYHFAEPPQPEPNVEITYSPSYEINIPSPHENSYSSGKYDVENHAPVQQPPLPQHPAPSYDEACYQDHPTYEQPVQQYHPANNYQPTDKTYQDISGAYKPASYKPVPSEHQIIDEYIPTSQDLPINVNLKQRPYDYPKSSYEVPIYDPLPFDASNHQESEIYPPQTFDESNRHQPPPPNNPAEHGPALKESTPNDVHLTDTRPETTVKRPQSPINRLRRNRKRKRTNGSTTTVSTTKHILDVPELEEAFEKENRHNYENSQEPDANESQRFENFNNQNIINDNYNKGPWNPMKIHTSSFIVKTTPSTKSAIKTLATKNKRLPYKQQRSTKTTTTTTTETPINVEIISIEKSKSQTYYEGVASTPRTSNKNNLFRNRLRLENGITSTTPQPHIKSKKDEINFSKRTTKNVFDTTIFKSPLNDRGNVHRNLPKNHKLF